MIQTEGPQFAQGFQEFINPKAEIQDPDVETHELMFVYMEQWKDHPYNLVNSKETLDDLDLEH